MCRMRKCFCWQDTKTVCVAVAVLALVTSLMQILFQIAVFTGDPTSTTAQSRLNGPADSASSIVPKLYIALAVADFFVVVFSLILLCGLERTAGCHYGAVPWIIWVFLYILYESAINIYYFTQDFNSSNPVIATHSLGYLIVPLVYWIVKDILLFIGWLFVVSWECYMDRPKDLDSIGSQSLQLIHHRNQNSCAASGSFGPIYYNGGASHIQVHDNPHSYVSHFDVARPTTVYTSNMGSRGAYLGGLYGPQRYVYTPN